MVLWSEYDQFEDILNQYLPDVGQGDSKASQAVVCVNALVYAFYNESDTSSTQVQKCSKWLKDNIPIARKYVEKLEDAESMNDYSDALYALADRILDNRALPVLAKQPAVGDVYSSTTSRATSITAAISDSYVNKLIDALHEDESFDDVTDARMDGDAINLTLTIGKQVSTVSIPIADLRMDDVEKDLNYIFDQLSKTAVKYNDWELTDSKQVEWNSKPTWYNMWYNSSADKYAFTLGDPDVAGPGEIVDWEEDTYDDAVDWFTRWGSDDQELTDSKIVESATNIFAADGIITQDSVIEWFENSEPNYAEDAKTEFNVHDLHDVDYDELMDWIADNDNLFEKMLQKLGRSEFVDSDARYLED